ncbi:hypothetical protein [Alkalihalobacterium elongatum]|uniref:hypothetical protein n=1 Tax=Alkalihalobacterium elongatum TaxID=2675466 RepID=UPI001C1FFDBB|nr:hypothetical protein [Alkalihalobacterium elongatum]
MNNEDYLNVEELKQIEQLTERMVKNASEDELKRCITEITMIKERARLRQLQMTDK